MEMHQVRYFIAVAKHLSFTRAAQELRVAQPSLTRAVQKLEAELGGPLLRRERLNTHLTELGRLMLPHLRAALAASDKAKVQAKLLQENAVGSLALGICTGIDVAGPAALVLDAVGGHPNLELLCEVAPAEAVERRLLTGEFDAALLAPVEPVADRLDLHPVRADDLVVAFPEGHRFATEETVAIEALSGEPLAVQFGCRVQEAFAHLVDANGVRPVVRLRSNETGWLAEFVRRARGCAVLPAASAAIHALANRRLDGVPFRQRTVLATVAGRRHSAAVAMLIQHMAAAARG